MLSHPSRMRGLFESSVNSYGRKMTMLDNAKANKFESSVNLYGRKT